MLLVVVVAVWQWPAASRSEKEEIWTACVTGWKLCGERCVSVGVLSCASAVNGRRRVSDSHDPNDPLCRWWRQQSYTRSHMKAPCLQPCVHACLLSRSLSLSLHSCRSSSTLWRQPRLPRRLPRKSAATRGNAGEPRTSSAGKRPAPRRRQLASRPGSATLTPCSSCSRCVCPCCLSTAAEVGTR